MTSPSALRRLVAALLLVVLPACYSYVPLETEPAAGQDVQVKLNDEGRQQAGLAESARDDGTLSAMVLRSSPDSITLSRGREGARHTSLGTTAIRDTLTLPRSSISEIDRSKLDVGRTAVLAALGAGAIAAAVLLVANANPNNTGGAAGGGSHGRTSQGGFGFRIPLSIP